MLHKRVVVRNLRKTVILTDIKFFSEIFKYSLELYLDKEKHNFLSNFLFVKLSSKINGHSQQNRRRKRRMYYNYIMVDRLSLVHYLQYRTLHTFRLIVWAIIFDFAIWVWGLAFVNNKFFIYYFRSTIPAAYFRLYRRPNYSSRFNTKVIVRFIWRKSAGHAHLVQKW